MFVYDDVFGCFLWFHLLVSPFWLCVYLGFLNFMYPSGVVRMYVKSFRSSSSALFWSVVDSTIHSPFSVLSRCRYLWVVFRHL